MNFLVEGELGHFRILLTLSSGLCTLCHVALSQSCECVLLNIITQLFEIKTNTPMMIVLKAKLKVLTLIYKIKNIIFEGEFFQPHNLGLNSG